MEDKPSLLSEFLRIYNTGNTDKEFNEVSANKGVSRRRVASADTLTNSGTMSLEDLYLIITNEANRRDVTVYKDYDTDNSTLLRLPLANTYRTIITLVVVAALGTTEINTNIDMTFDDNANLIAFNALTVWIRTE